MLNSTIFMQTFPTSFATEAYWTERKKNDTFIMVFNIEFLQNEV